MTGTCRQAYFMKSNCAATLFTRTIRARAVHLRAQHQLSASPEKSRAVPQVKSQTPGPGSQGQTGEVMKRRHASLKNYACSPACRKTAIALIYYEAQTLKSTWELCSAGCRGGRLRLARLLQKSVPACIASSRAARQVQAKLRSVFASRLGNRW